MSRVLMAMSGGVDSSVAAALLVEQGHDVVGVTMKTFCYSDTPAHSKTCCGLDGLSDAKRVAAALGIPHYVFDVEEAFERNVIDNFVTQYAEGKTPNPCVRCNGYTKFRDLLSRGRALGCNRIASGHYVQIEHTHSRSKILRGQDKEKDQSYFLWALPHTLLKSLLFPIGNLTKAQVRERARSQGLVNSDKPESQEICFVPTGDYRDLLRERLGELHPALQPGHLVRRSGEIVGEHSGYAGFTIGQRKGLGGGSDEPMFVLSISPDTKEVVVGTRLELFDDVVVISGLNWLGEPLEDGGEALVQLRHRAPTVPAVVRSVEDQIVLELEEAQAAVTPGQSAVLFDQEDRCVMGGGTIVSARSR